MTMIWTVRQLIEKLQTEYDPEEQIVFNLLSQGEVANTLKTFGPHLEDIMFHLQRVCDGLDTLMGQQLSLAVSEARLEPNTEICLLCHKRGGWASVRPNVEDVFCTLTFCEQCRTLQGIFKGILPVNCDGKWVIASDLFSEFLALPFHTITWGEFTKPADRKMWRSSVIVISLSWSDDTVTVMVPSWHTDKHVTTRLSAVPAPIRNGFESGYRCHAQVNSGADEAADLIFVNWGTL